MEHTSTQVAFKKKKKKDQKDQKFLRKDLEDPCIGMNIKQKEKIKTKETNIDIFSNPTL